MSSKKESQQPQEFQYLMSFKGPLILVTLVGEIKIDCLEKLKECQKEVLANDSLKYFILYMRDVSNITVDAIPFITQFQKHLRSKGQLRVCSINPDLKEKLTKLGVIRAPEIVNNLQLALQEILDSRIPS